MARILIGCKADLEEYRAISYSTAQKLAETNKMLHFEASTKSSGNYMGRLLDISNFIIERYALVQYISANRKMLKKQTFLSNRLLFKDSPNRIFR